MLDYEKFIDIKLFLLLKIVDFFSPSSYNLSVI